MSGLNKPQNSNKQLAYWESETELDKDWEPIQVGSSGQMVKLLVNYHSLVGGGLGEPKGEVWDPLGKPQTITKVGWVELSLLNRELGCPAGHFQGYFSPQEKITKMYGVWELED